MEIIKGDQSAYRIVKKKKNELQFNELLMKQNDFFFLHLM